MSIEELVGRLEALTGPDKQCDALIYGCVHWPHGKWEAVCLSSRRDEYGEWLVLRRTIENHGTLTEPPDYTASLDAALTLLEPGCEYSISTLHCIANVEVGLNCGGELEPQSSRRLDCNVILAMCEAALKFRAHVNERASEKEMT